MNKATILKNDYEHYSLLLPVKYFAGRRLYKYVYSQLEKLHPCFSENFCFDTRIGLKKKNLYADVFVMDKRKLSEYKLKFPGRIFTVEENNKINLFSGWQKFRWIGILTLFLISVTAVLGISTWKKSFRFESVEKNQNKTSEPMKNNLVGLEKNIDVWPRSDYLEKFFSVIEQNRGKIQQINWKCDGNEIALDSCVSNIYPELFREYFSEGIMKNVSYKGKIPFLTLTMTEKAVQKNYQELMKTEELVDWNTRLRTIVFDYGGSVLEENPENFLLTFQIKKENTESFISAVENLWNEKLVSIEKLDIKTEPESFVFSVRPSSGNHHYQENLFRGLCSFFSKVMDMTVKVSPVTVPSKMSETVHVAPVHGVGNPVGVEKSENNQLGKNQIGKITHSDGSVSSFYKGPDRKIAVLKMEGK